MTDIATTGRGVNFDSFNRDAESHGAYLYTNNAQLSCQLATQRQQDIILEIGRFAGRTVLDIGCGDGYNSINLWDHGRPAAMTGIDPADNAISVANASKESRPITFEVADAHRLPFADSQFDIAVIQGVLHHDDDAQDIVREAFRVAREIVVLEPNGNNLGLKAIEKLSRYHREHHEKSYRPRLLQRWTEECGGKIVRERFAGLVPIFCPDWIARCAKASEPVVERIPLARAYGCAIYAFVARRGV